MSSPFTSVPPNGRPSFKVVPTVGTQFNPISVTGSTLEVGYGQDGYGEGGYDTLGTNTPSSSQPNWTAETVK